MSSGRVFVWNMAYSSLLYPAAVMICSYQFKEPISGAGFVRSGLVEATKQQKVSPQERRVSKSHAKEISWNQPK